MPQQSRQLQEALAEPDAIKRLINVFELLHPIPLSDPRHGFVDAPQLVREAHAEIVTLTGEEV